MSWLASQHDASTAAPPKREPVIVQAARETLVLRWSLSREASIAAGVVDAEDAAEPATGPFLEVHVPWGSTVDHIGAAIVDGERRDELRLEGAPAGAWTAGDNGLRHLDLPGLLRITAQSAAGGVSVLYARTELLGRLGLAGGRYDFEGCSLRSER